MSEPTLPTNEVRAIRSSPEIRGGDNGVTMSGHFSMFDTWYEVNSSTEGRFMEAVAPGAFTKTIRENRDGVKVLFNHGQDPTVGDKVLGTIIDLEEDGQGARYAVSMFDTSYNRDLTPALRAGVYGASFRFQMVNDELEGDPGRSDHNPDGLPERVIREAKLLEFGPVTFPASSAATAGVRSISLTDQWLRARGVTPDDSETATPDQGPASEQKPPEPPEHSDGLTPAQRQKALRQFDI